MLGWMEDLINEQRAAAEKQARYAQKVDLGPIKNFSSFNSNMNDQSVYDELDAAQKARLAAIGADWSQAGSETYAKEINDMYTKAAESAKYKLQYNPLETDEKGDARLKDAYKANDGSNYIEELLKKQGQGEMFARDDANAQAQGALVNANAGLSMRGGLNSANRANLARYNMRDALMASQGVSRQGMGERANINVKGPVMKQDADKQNLSNTLSSIGAVNQFNLEKYKQKMSVEAANKQAEATRASGGEK